MSASFDPQFLASQETALEALYHVAFAAPVPLILLVLAYRAEARSARAALLLTSLTLFGLLYVASYALFCVGCT